DNEGPTPTGTTRSSKVLEKAAAVVLAQEPQLAVDEPEQTAHDESAGMPTSQIVLDMSKEVEDQDVSKEVDQKNIIINHDAFDATTSIDVSIAEASATSTTAASVAEVVPNTNRGSEKFSTADVLNVSKEVEDQDADTRTAAGRSTAQLSATQSRPSSVRLSNFSSGGLVEDVTFGTSARMTTQEDEEQVKDGNEHHATSTHYPSSATSTSAVSSADMIDITFGGPRIDSSTSELTNKPFALQVNKAGEEPAPGPRPTQDTTTTGDHDQVQDAPNKTRPTESDYVFPTTTDGQMITRRQDSLEIEKRR
ncbi:unnamed protein product, partial [Amoebophrya sp. A25]